MYSVALFMIGSIVLVTHYMPTYNVYMLFCFKVEGKSL